MTATTAVRYEQAIPDIFQAMKGVHAAMDYLAECARAPARKVA